MFCEDTTVWQLPHNTYLYSRAVDIREALSQRAWSSKHLFKNFSHFKDKLLFIFKVLAAHFYKNIGIKVTDVYKGLKQIKG